MKQQALFDEFDAGATIHSIAADTEHDALASIQPHLTELRLNVLRSLAANDNGATGSQTADDTGIWLYTAKPRITELKNMGLVEDTGQRVKNARGHSEIVWSVTNLGRKVLTHAGS